MYININIYISILICDRYDRLQPQNLISLTVIMMCVKKIKISNMKQIKRKEKNVETYQ